MDLKITKVTNKPFTGSDGEEINYYWYKAVRRGDGVTIEFGSKNEYEEGEQVELLLEKIETKRGYKYLDR